MFINILLSCLLLYGLAKAFRGMRKEFSDDPCFFWCMTVVVWISSTIPYGLAINFLAPLEGIDRTTSKGERVGTITRLSETGLFWKTWEGELQSGAEDGEGKGKVYHFSVLSPELRGTVKGCLGKKMILEYREWLCMPYRVGASGYEIVGIRQP